MKYWEMGEDIALADGVLVRNLYFCTLNKKNYQLVGRCIEYSRTHCYSDSV